MLAKGKWTREVRAARERTVFRGVGRETEKVVVTALDRYATEGDPAELKR